MEQLPDDLNIHIFDLANDMNVIYNLIQLNKYFHTIYINKYKKITEYVIQVNKLFYSDTVWFM